MGLALTVHCTKSYGDHDMSSDNKGGNSGFSNNNTARNVHSRVGASVVVLVCTIHYSQI